MIGPLHKWPISEKHGNCKKMWTFLTVPRQIFAAVLFAKSLWNRLWKQPLKTFYWMMKDWKIGEEKKKKWNSNLFVIVESKILNCSCNNRIMTVLWLLRMWKIRVKIWLLDITSQTKYNNDPQNLTLWHKFLRCLTLHSCYLVPTIVPPPTKQKN